MIRFRQLVLAGLVGPFLCSNLLAATIHVPADAPTINAGLAVASSGDTVLVAPGVYSDWESRVIPGIGLVRSAAFLEEGVTLKSSGGSAVTTLDVLGSATVQVIAGHSLGSQGTIVEGFTIVAPPSGAVVRLTTSPGIARLRDCLLLGSGVPGIWATSIPLEVEGCEFRDFSGNSAIRATAVVGDGSTLDVTDCAFEDNDVTSGAAGSGAAMIVTDYGIVSVRQSSFYRNRARLFGGAISIRGTLQPEVTECLFVDNSATTAGGSVDIGGFATFRGNTVVGSFATNSGAAALFSEAFTGGMFDNNIIVGTLGSDAVRSAQDTNFMNSCNIFWDIQDGIGLFYQLDARDRIHDPLFCDPDNDDYTLRIDSPGVPENSNGCGQIGAFGRGCGAISVERTSWGRVKAVYQ